MDKAKGESGKIDSPFVCPETSDGEAANSPSASTESPSKWVFQSDYVILYLKN
jgi:hypothetical protein